MGRSETKDDCKNELVEICAATMALKRLGKKYNFGSVANNEEINRAEKLLRDLLQIFTVIEDAEELLNKAIELSDEFESSYVSGGGLEQDEDLGDWPGYLYKFYREKKNKSVSWDGSSPSADFIKFSKWLDENFRINYIALESAVGRYTRFADLPGVYISSF